MKQKLLIVLAIILIGITSKVQAYSFSAVCSSGQKLFYNITAPNTVELTYEFPFDPYYNTAPTGNLIIPDSVSSNGITYNVTSIGKNTFTYCRNLNSVIIPNSVKIIKKSAFNYSYIPSISIGNSVTTIEDDAFSYCDQLTSITIPNSVISIGTAAFSDCYKLTSVIIGNSLDSISQYAFFNCINLTSVIFGSSVKSIGQGAFYNCRKLASFTIPNSVTAIKYAAFKGCSGLTSITIPNSINTIESSVFSYCAALISVTIPSSVTSIGSYAFEYCSSLTSITIPNSVTSIGSGGGNFAFDKCTSLSSIDVDIYNSKYSSIDGVLCNKNSDTIIFYPQGKIGNYTIPNCVTSIGLSAFSNCNNLTSVTIPNSVTSIGYSAFYGCTSLTSIICKALNPPQIKFSSPFSSLSKTIPVYVPCGSKSKYQSASYWNEFTNIIEGNLIIFYDIACKGQIYNNYGFNLIADSTSLYTHNIQSSNGCDSIIILDLTVAKNYSDTLTASICQGQIYNQYGFNADSTGVYTQNLQTINGCDSILTLNLTINPIYSTIYYDSICQGQTYNNYGFNINATDVGTFINEIKTIYGCDSVILNLTVNPSPITPSGLLVERKHSYLEITWDSVGESYEVYRDDSLIATTSQAIYQDSNVVNDSSYCYKVKAFIGNCESDFSVAECMQFVGLNDININNQDITLYPNPTSSNIYLKIDQSIIGSGYTITNTLGKIVLQGKLLDVSMNINLYDFHQGIYFLNIEKTKQTIKVIKQ